MATVGVLSVFQPGTTSGLGRDLDMSDLNVSRATYNKLPGFEGQCEFAVKHDADIKALVKIIHKHSMGNFSRLHTAHNHGPIAAGMINIDSPMGNTGFTWTKATSPQATELSKMHATLFKVTEKGLVPYEFAAGPSPLSGVSIPADFLDDFAKYILDRGLTDLVALEIGDIQKQREMGPKAEFDIQWGEEYAFTVVVPVSVVNEFATELVITGWNQEPDGQPAPGTHWATVTAPKNTHKVFVDSMEAPTPERVLQKLTDLSYIKS